MIVKDDRTEEQRATHRWLVVATDRFMSGWGHAEGGTSVCGWAFASADEAHAALPVIRANTDMRHVRVVFDGVVRRGKLSPTTRWKPKGCAHWHLYVGMGGAA